MVKHSQRIERISLNHHGETMNLFSEHFELTEKYLSKIFDTCNNLYFENSLIKIPVTVIENETVNGYFKFDIDFENKILKNPRIEISKTHKRPYEALERTILHEMVHYKVFLELTSVEIAAAFDAYNTENTDLFNKILYLENYAHENKWNSYITYINNKYNLKIG